MSKKLGILLAVLSVLSFSQIIAEGDKKELSYQKNKQIETRSIVFDQEEVIQIDFKILKEELSLTKKQIKKISSKYNKYLKKQLKIKEKIVVSKVSLNRLMIKSFYEDYEIDDVVNEIFSMKKKLYKNSVFFIKELESKFKKDQIILFRQLVPELYNVQL
ncbi:MAG: hypothetical protein CMP21_08185 [Rickettsiales bacterium]|nr:hypothetical protein [Rickettsiales bacterium]|tara:strand:- start:2200 stop:2679 length:480 start_codon:yes stop_codon:yes gene_type:complete